MYQYVVWCAGFCVLLFSTGCVSEKDVSEVGGVVQGMREESYASLSRSFKEGLYARAVVELRSFMEQYPDDERRALCQLMLADALYELKEYPEAYERYRHFADFYPADRRAEYALYKGAHAKFAQAPGVHCDSTAVEEAQALCTEYLAHEEYKTYRTLMESLEQKCTQRLLEKELYIAYSYLHEGRVQSARQRLDDIKKNFDVEKQGVGDRVLYYEARIAHQQNRSADAEASLEALRATYPQSHFTTMAQLLTKQSFWA